MSVEKILKSYLEYKTGEKIEVPKTVIEEAVDKIESLKQQLSKPEFDGVVGAEIADKLREIKTIMRDFYLESATGNESEDKR